MGKTPLRRVKQSKQDDSGWVRGFVSMFYFRRSGYKHKSLPEPRLGSRVRSGDGFSQNMIRSLEYSGYQLEDDAPEITQTAHGMQSVKQLMEEENCDNLEYQQKGQNIPVSVDINFKSLATDEDINSLVREIFIRIQHKRFKPVEEQKDDFGLIQENIHTRFVDKLVESTKVVLLEKLISGLPRLQGGKVCYSREFTDALETLFSHKDLFFKLLEDPNSELSRRINNLVNEELRKRGYQKESERPHHSKKSLFSRRRVISQQVILPSDNEGSESPFSNSVSDSGSEPFSGSNTGSSSASGSTNKSSFSFTEIIRRLKRAVGKDRKETCTNNRNVLRAGGDSSGRISSFRNPHLEAEIYPRSFSSHGSMERIDMTFEQENISKTKSGRYFEPNEHSSQLLTDEYDDDKFSEGHELELAMESDSACSPTLQSSRSSPRKLPSSSEKPLEKNVNAAVDQPADIVAEHTIFDDGEDESQCLMEITSAGDVSDLHRQKVEDATEYSNTNESGEISPSSPTMDGKGDDSEDYDEQDENGGDCKTSSKNSSAASYSSSDKIERLQGGRNKTEQTSPVTVLEPVYLEDEISPPSAIKFQGEAPAAPLQITFEDYDSHESVSKESTLGRKSWDVYKSKEMFVKEILKASEFSWDKFHTMSLSSDQLLDKSLYNNAEVDIHSDQPANCYMLLFDCINEVLKDLHDRYFGSYPWVCVAKSSIRPIPDAENAFVEIWERVEWHLLPVSTPGDLDLIVAKDFGKDGEWMDIRPDIDTIGTEIEYLIFKELIKDTVLSCFSEDTRTMQISLNSLLTARRWSRKMSRYTR